MTSARIRFLWAVFSYIVVQSLLLGVAVTPAALLHAWATPYLRLQCGSASSSSQSGRSRFTC